MTYMYGLYDMSYVYFYLTSDIISVLCYVYT